MTSLRVLDGYLDALTGCSAGILLQTHIDVASLSLMSLTTARQPGCQGHCDLKIELLMQLVGSCERRMIRLSQQLASSLVHSKGQGPPAPDPQHPESS